MQWLTTKPATSNGEPVPVGTKGEGEVPAHLIGKVSFLIVATPQAEPEAEPEGEEEVAETELTEQVEAEEVAEAELEAEKPTKGGKR